MAPNSPAARAVAHRLLARADAPTELGADDPNAAAAADPVAAAERVCQELVAELARWFGPYGVHALLTRALAQAQADHPALGAVSIHEAGERCLDGLADAARAHGTGAATEGVAALVAALIDLLGRLIGEDMAVNLVSQVMMSSAPAAGPAAGPQAGGAGTTGGAADVGAVP